MSTNSILLQPITAIILESRRRVFGIANATPLRTYWQIGKLIIEDEQHGEPTATCGNATLKTLATQLTLEFGRGFDERNLNNMRAFYKTFPIWNALRTELGWTHCRLQCRLDTEAKRNYYLQESMAGNWNSRTLQRHINSLAFERVLVHKTETTEPNTIQHLLKDPCISGFLGLPHDTKNSERSIENRHYRSPAAVLAGSWKKLCVCGAAAACRNRHLLFLYIPCVL